MEFRNNIMLYGSEIWAETLKVKKGSYSLASVYITAALHIASAYCTVSTLAALVIAGTIPVYQLDGYLLEAIGWKSHNQSLQEKHHFKVVTTMEQ